MKRENQEKHDKTYISWQYYKVKINKISMHIEIALFLRFNSLNEDIEDIEDITYASKQILLLV